MVQSKLNHWQWQGLIIKPDGFIQGTSGQWQLRDMRPLVARFE